MQVYAEIPPFGEAIEYITQDEPVALKDGTIYYGVTLHKIDLDSLVSPADGIVLGEKPALSDATIEGIVKELQMVTALDRQGVKVIETVDKIIPKDAFAAINKWMTEKALPILKKDATWEALTAAAQQIPPDKLSTTDEAIDGNNLHIPLGL